MLRRGLRRWLAALGLRHRGADDPHQLVRKGRTHSKSGNRMGLVLVRSRLSGGIGEQEGERDTHRAGADREAVRVEVRIVSHSVTSRTVTNDPAWTACAPRP